MLLNPKRHPSADALDRFIEEHLTVEELLPVHNHVLWCGECRQVIHDRTLLRRLLAKSIKAGEFPHARNNVSDL
jgi:hypothetical protein